MVPRKHYNFRQHMKPILIFFAFSASVTIYKYLDTAMLGFMKGNQEVGYYSASVRITDLLVSFVTAPGAVLLPRISYYVKEGHLKEFSTLVHKALDLILFVSVPVCIYFEFMADSSIFFISGPAYAGSIPPMRNHLYRNYRNYRCPDSHPSRPRDPRRLFHLRRSCYGSVFKLYFYPALRLQRCRVWNSGS
mgnify:CR=1 FL=1